MKYELFATHRDCWFKSLKTCQARNLRDEWTGPLSVQILQKQTQVEQCEGDVQCEVGAGRDLVLKGRAQVPTLLLRSTHHSKAQDAPTAETSQVQLLPVLRREEGLVRRLCFVVAI